MSITKEYSAAFSVLGMRGHEPPKDELLQDYRKFREWWQEYSKSPEDMGSSPYKKYSHGFSVKR